MVGQTQRAVDGREEENHKTAQGRTEKVAASVMALAVGKAVVPLVNAGVFGIGVVCFVVCCREPATGNLHAVRSGAIGKTD